MPNLIICGPPGTGKTTSVHALAHSMLGDAYAVRLLQPVLSILSGWSVGSGERRTTSRLIYMRTSVF